MGFFVQAKITEEHRLLHYVRHLRLVELGKEEALGYSLFEFLPSEYLRTEKEGWWIFKKDKIVLTEKGSRISDVIYTAAMNLDRTIADIVHANVEKGNYRHGEAAVHELAPILLNRFGFKSRSDYLVKWSIFKGALGREGPPLRGGNLTIHDQLYRGECREECMATLDQPVEELEEALICCP